MKKLLVSLAAAALLIPTATANALTLDEQLNGSTPVAGSEPVKVTGPATTVVEKPELTDKNNDLHKVRLSENGEAKFNELDKTSTDLTPKAPEAATTTVAATTKATTPAGKAPVAGKTNKAGKVLPKTSAVK